MVDKTMMGDKCAELVRRAESEPQRHGLLPVPQ